MANRLSILKTILWASVGVLAAITVVRFRCGLGAVTDLSDAAPWGLWIAFDVMAGVALAAGGFVLAGTVYIFGLQQYRPFVRPAILTALLGYLAVAVGLLYDLGLPWHIWHPLIHWQHHSVLFEVAMCVMLYLTVLCLEFAPVVLEHRLFSHALFRLLHAAVKKMTIPLIITGIVLSTLHQSSLGSLFLITPYRLHPLWYSPIIYLLFFVSAVALGLMTVVLEALLSSYFLGHKVSTRLLSGLGLAAAVVLGLYAVLRLGDLAVRGRLITVLDGSWQSRLFLVELAVSAVIPGILLLFRTVRSRVGGLAVCAGLTVLGMVLNRIDVGIIALARPDGMGYVPTWMELGVSLGIVSGGVLLFLFFVERFRVFEEGELALAPAQPSCDPATLHDLMPHELAAPRWYSLVATVAAAVTVVFLPVHGAEPIRIPISKSRAVEGLVRCRNDGPGRVLALRVSAPAEGNGAECTPLMAIDGNRDGMMVLFDHAGHVDRTGGEGSCAVCHHLNMPLDRNSPCYECHTDMYEPTALFDHASHVEKLGENDSCYQCHGDYTAVKSAKTATACGECHEYQAGPDPVIAPPGRTWGKAVGYMDAMHGLCIRCHQKAAEQAPGSHSASLDRCIYCHDMDRAQELVLLAPGKTTRAAPAPAAR